MLICSKKYWIHNLNIFSVSNYELHYYIPMIAKVALKMLCSKTTQKTKIISITMYSRWMKMREMLPEIFTDEHIRRLYQLTSKRYYWSIYLCSFFFFWNFIENFLQFYQNWFFEKEITQYWLLKIIPYQILLYLTQINWQFLLDLAKFCILSKCIDRWI